MPKPLPYRELRKRLKKFGVREVPGRGKGSERMLLKPESPGSKRGPTYPIKCHGEGDEISVGSIKAALRRFDIDPDKSW